MQHTVKHLCGHTTAHQIIGDDLPSPSIVKHLQSQDCQSCHFQSVMDGWRQKLNEPANINTRYNFLLPIKTGENQNLSTKIEKLEE